MVDWRKLLDDELAALEARDPALHEFVEANVASVEQLIRGTGPDDTEPTEGAGACIVFNMSAKHVPAFCAGGAEAYLNAYKLNRVGDRRRTVDDAVVSACEPHAALEPEDICFGAVETNGTGIRFFGDFCLVLRERPAWDEANEPTSKSSRDPRNLLVLERNSYDVAREPVVARIREAHDAGGALPRERDAAAALARSAVIGGWIGRWEKDLIPMLALRLLTELPRHLRRWTTGAMASGVLDDEDYCEVLFPHSFGVAGLREVRTSANEAAAEGDIANRERSGEGPALHELEWRQQRREARRALHSNGLALRIVTTPGRVKGR